ncbi:MAG: SulP family inorganic anion transporter [Candidatus Dadabacteria bacterium]|nr:SulP family inorganic anion transporter [Candidatus Dadabacteria bacterium]MYA48182.1 SulP family inorganic anion transporter [Candidatus Dadabacteria bacterium]MYG83652.1 SulP family inorganic anion transporter [Candidatus Dadabacteria bacterium]MYK49537.1 SulP family inorganic anion transporter [Candidatus Dadabacteria bacterium]
MRHTFLDDVFGGVTSAIVMLPLALAFGVASGLGPVAGIYGAVAVGFFAAAFGGTPAQISGPTGPMTIAMAAIVTLYAHDLATAFTIVMLAGLIQISLGFLRVGRFVSYTPYSVISGFMTGIGVIIIILQVVTILGAEPIPGGPLVQIAAWPEAIANPNPHDFAVGLIALAICVFWPRRIRRFLPPALAALTIGTCIAFFGLTEARTMGAIPAGLPTFQVPQMEWGSIGHFLEPALILALLGSIDSLLTSLIADSQTRTRHNPDRELVGQGLGNLAAGILGALPGSGAPLVTVTNIRAGGRSPLAGILTAVLLLGLLLGFGWIAEPIPLAVLAGILIKVGWDIIDWRFVVHLRAIRLEYVFIMLLTFLVTVFVDLVTAVALGLITAGVVRSRDLTQNELEGVFSLPVLDFDFLPSLADIDPYNMPVGFIKLRGSFSIASANELTRVIAADIEDHDVIILDFSETTSVDDSAALAIEELVQSAIDDDTACIVLGLSGDVGKVLQSLKVFHRVPAGNFVDSLDEAKQLSKDLLQKRGADDEA